LAAALGRRPVPVPADLSQPGAGHAAAGRAAAALGGLDILVICASVQARHDFAEVTAAGIEWQIRVNLTVSVELLQAILPGMKARGWGRVLSIGSANQTRPEAALSIYAALKAAQHNLIINLARQYAPFGVTLNTLSPGLVATERNRW
jgi:NAD(P)-dependent dehydrogenase (short-subunit alcohol dehydrogenase family)